MTYTRATGARQPVLLAALMGIFALAYLPPSISQSEIAADSSADQAANVQGPAASDPAEAITVGPRAAIGTDTAAEKAADTVVGGVIGGIFGRSDSTPRSERPDTRRDPTRKLDYAEFEALDGGLETGARARWTEHGLLVSTRIDDAPARGTFQAVFLQACDGRRLHPVRYEIYRLWPEGGVSVSWSRGTTRDGKIVEQDSGSLSGQWDDGVGHADLATGPGTWRQLGFDKAHHGARQIGAYFEMSPEALARFEDARLFVHTTLPSRDPVTTAASVWAIAPGAGGSVLLEVPDEHPESWWGRCRGAVPVQAAADRSLFWDAFTLIGAAFKIPVDAQDAQAGTHRYSEEEKNK